MRDKNLGAGKTPEWAGATPLFARLRGQSDPWGRSSPLQREGVVLCRRQMIGPCILYCTL